jgi:two-component system cell cycle sensor histidine kinase/response regulator CckA
VLAPISLDVGDVIRGAESLLRPTLGTRTAWSVVEDPRVGPVVADRGQLEQVLLNLVLNARDAIAESGRPGAVTVRVAPWWDEPDTADDQHDTHGGTTPRAWTRVTVTDTGQGMSADTLAHACDPFFTTKVVGKGSGLGLAMVHGIVRQSGGRVGIASTPGSGTTVTFDLPVVRFPAAPHGAGQDDEATDRPAHNPGTLTDTRMTDTACAATPTRTLVSVSALSGGAVLRGMDTDDASAPGASAVDPEESSGCVLLVEDDPALRRLAARMLERAGFSVLTCEDGDAAWRAWEAARPRIRGVVSDVRMPGRDGHALRRSLRMQSRALPIVLMSGHAEQPVEEIGTMDTFLEKPFTSAQLLEALAAIGLHP